MTPRMWFDVAMLALVLLAGAGLVWGYKEFQAMQAKVEAMESVSNVTSEATDALSTATQAQQDIHFTIEDKRATQDAIYEKLLRNDPSAKSWADTPLPDSLRNSDGSTIDGLEDHPAGRGIADPEN